MANETIKTDSSLEKKCSAIVASDDFIRICKDIVAKYTTDHMDKSDSIAAKPNDVYCVCVWYAKELKNHKGLFSTKFPDGMYYEITFNGEKDELHIDAYKKIDNFSRNLTNILKISSTQ